MKNRFLFYFVLTALVYSCKEENKANNVDSNIGIEAKGVTQQQKLELLLQDILNTEDLNKSINVVNDKTNLELYLAKHDSFGITPNVNLEKFGKKIQVIDYEKAQRDSILNIIYFNEFNLKQDTARVEFFHVIRGLGGEATLVYKNNKWKKISSSYWYD